MSEIIYNGNDDRSIVDYQSYGMRNKIEEIINKAGFEIKHLNIETGKDKISIEGSFLAVYKPQKI